MKLTDVARYFDKTPAYDPDTGAFLFNCQLSNYDGSHRDAHAAYRRILSVRPGAVFPASKTIKIFNEVWIIAESQYDGFAEIHRQRHVIQRVNEKLEIFTIADFLAGVAAEQVWGDVQWVVGTREKDYSSFSPQIYDVYLPLDYDLPPHRLVRYRDRLYFGQFQYDSAAGYTVYRTMRQDYGAHENVTLTHKKYNPAIGKAEELSQDNVPCLMVRWQEFYEYEEQLADRYKVGDRVFLFQSNTNVTRETRIRTSGREWAVLGISTKRGVVVVHGRPS